jgi:hypothetical protein
VIQKKFYDFFTTIHSSIHENCLSILIMIYEE